MEEAAGVQRACALARVQRATMERNVVSGCCALLVRCLLAVNRAQAQMGLQRAGCVSRSSSPNQCMACARLSPHMLAWG